MSTTFCLDCDHEINLAEHLEMGQEVKCPNCKIKMEIIQVEPLRLDWAYEGPVTNLLFSEDWDKGI
jgi:lysine biosynthesis protein LysW